MKHAVLIVDDDPFVNEFVTEALTRLGYETESVLSGEDALVAMDDREFDIVLTDLKMGGMDGLELLRSIRRRDAQAIVMIMTAYGSVETAVRAVKDGAYDFLIKPVTPETLEIKLGQAVETLLLRQENQQLRQDLTHDYMSMIGKSGVMREVYEKIQAAATARSTVLLTGGSGTGKEMVARALHFASPRSNGPFVRVNCAALPDELVESMLFGHEKGAFTHAYKATRGRFEVADGGTILLDEISEMNINLQGKLLRVLQESEFERVGSEETIKVDVRVIATSNRNLKEYIERRQFRDDLYYRLAVVPIHLPSLEQRKEDIPLLVDHFVRKYNAENGRSVKGLTRGALNLFAGYHWPGNVRELENVIEGAIVMARDEWLTEDDFPMEMSLGRVADHAPSFEVPLTIKEGNRFLVLKTLEFTNNNRTEAARRLGITTRTLRNWLNEWGMGAGGGDSDDEEEESAGTDRAGSAA